MKRLLTIPALLLFHLCLAQQREADFDAIDSYVQTVSHTSPDSLALKLTENYQTELEKTRAIFSWITQNIVYNTGIYSAVKSFAPKYSFDPLDTMTVWKSGDEMAAIRVLHRRVTVCEGYARLFKVLCDHAGLKAELVVGYARSGTGKQAFRCNHTWNVVMIDSVWKLIDVTWASGFVNYRNEFVQQIDEDYFLPEPGEFIRDHYPEDLRWALVNPVPFYREFERAPFRYKCFDKYKFTSVPQKGAIEAAEGDTVRIELNVKDVARDKQISSNPFFDSSVVELSPQSVFLHPIYDNNKLIYTWQVTGTSVQWLHLFYNNDLVLRYHFRLKNKLQEPGK